MTPSTVTGTGNGIHFDKEFNKKFCLAGTGGDGESDCEVAWHGAQPGMIAEDNVEVRVESTTLVLKATCDDPNANDPNDITVLFAAANADGANDSEQCGCQYSGFTTGLIQSRMVNFEEGQLFEAVLDTDGLATSTVASLWFQSDEAEISLALQGTTLTAHAYVFDNDGNIDPESTATPVTAADVDTAGEHVWGVQWEVGGTLHFFYDGTVVATIAAATWMPSAMPALSNLRMMIDVQIADSATDAHLSAMETNCVDGTPLVVSSLVVLEAATWEVQCGQSTGYYSHVLSQSAYADLQQKDGKLGTSYSDPAVGNPGGFYKPNGQYAAGARPYVNMCVKDGDKVVNPGSGPQNAALAMATFKLAEACAGTDREHCGGPLDHIALGDGVNSGETFGGHGSEGACWWDFTVYETPNLATQTMGAGPMQTGECRPYPSAAIRNAIATASMETCGPHNNRMAPRRFMADTNKFEIIAETLIDSEGNKFVPDFDQEARSKAAADAATIAYDTDGTDDNDLRAVMEAAKDELVAVTALVDNQIREATAAHDDSFADATKGYGMWCKRQLAWRTTADTVNKGNAARTGDGNPVFGGECVLRTRINDLFSDPTNQICNNAISAWPANGDDAPPDNVADNEAMSTFPTQLLVKGRGARDGSDNLEDPQPLGSDYDRYVHPTTAYDKHSERYYGTRRASGLDHCEKLGLFGSVTSSGNVLKYESTRHACHHPSADSVAHLGCRVVTWKKAADTYTAPYLPQWSSEASPLRGVPAIAKLCVSLPVHALLWNDRTKETGGFTGEPGIAGYPPVHTYPAPDSWFNPFLQAQRGEMFWPSPTNGAYDWPIPRLVYRYDVEARWAGKKNSEKICDKRCNDGADTCADDKSLYEKVMADCQTDGCTAAQITTLKKKWGQAALTMGNTRCYRHKNTGVWYSAQPSDGENTNDCKFSRTFTLEVPSPTCESSKPCMCIPVYGGKATAKKCKNVGGLFFSVTGMCDDGGAGAAKQCGPAANNGKRTKTCAVPTCMVPEDCIEAEGYMCAATNDREAAAFDKDKAAEDVATFMLNALAYGNGDLDLQATHSTGNQVIAVDSSELSVKIDPSSVRVRGRRATTGFTATIEFDDVLATNQERIDVLTKGQADAIADAIATRVDVEGTPSAKSVFQINGASPILQETSVTLVKCQDHTKPLDWAPGQKGRICADTHVETDYDINGPGEEPVSVLATSIVESEDYMSTGSMRKGVCGVTPGGTNSDCATAGNSDQSNAAACDAATISGGGGDAANACVFVPVHVEEGGDAGTSKANVMCRGQWIKQNNVPVLFQESQRLTGPGATRIDLLGGMYQNTRVQKKLDFKKAGENPICEQLGGVHTCGVVFNVQNGKANRYWKRSGRCLLKEEAEAFRALIAEKAPCVNSDGEGNYCTGEKCNTKNCDEKTHLDNKAYMEKTAQCNFDVKNAQSYSYINARGKPKNAVVTADYQSECFARPNQCTGEVTRLSNGKTGILYDAEHYGAFMHSGVSSKWNPVLVPYTQNMDDFPNWAEWENSAGPRVMTE